MKKSAYIIPECKYIVVEEMSDLLDMVGSITGDPDQNEDPDDDDWEPDDQGAKTHSIWDD